VNQASQNSTAKAPSKGFCAILASFTETTQKKFECKFTQELHATSVFRQQKATIMIIEVSPTITWRSILKAVCNTLRTKNTLKIIIRLNSSRPEK